MNSDRHTIQLVIGLIGFITSILVIGILALSLQSLNVPEGMMTLAASGIGALGGMLAVTRTGGQRNSDTAVDPTVANAKVENQNISLVAPEGDASTSRFSEADRQAIAEVVRGVIDGYGGVTNEPAKSEDQPQEPTNPEEARD